MIRITVAERTFCPGNPSYLVRRGLNIISPRIIGGPRPHSADTPAFNGQPISHSTVVIADSGAMAELLVFPPDEPIDLGTRFHYRGTVWEVSGKRDSGILVAEPSRH